MYILHVHIAIRKHTGCSKWWETELGKKPLESQLLAKRFTGAITEYVIQWNANVCLILKSEIRNFEWTRFLAISRCSGSITLKFTSFEIRSRWLYYRSSSFITSLVLIHHMGGNVSRCFPSVLHHLHTMCN